ncbi:cytochrome P450 [Streptomyces sp. NBC_00237]|uniref:cytochrome P450 n=1 Tax=Streptomyces sp. NBC_00237 TaxID=2975687 RepID=UPI0022522633|nr:cytochrome P450 [Streptomyces sp. NBC_00237]MCX5204436.1 cytochrome P450 [Streptomyces sp. NBC_00237]
MREHQNVHWHSSLDAWAVTGHAECRQVLGDTTAFGSDFRRVGEEVPDSSLNIQALDPPEHGPVRHLLVAALHDEPPAAMADRVARIGSSHVSRLPRPGRVDLVADFARPVALETMCAFLGVEPPEGEKFEEMSNAIVRSMDGGLDPQRVEPGIVARQQLSSLVAQWLAEGDASGFIGAARRANLREPTVSSSVLENSLRAVLHAGYESVSRLLGNAIARYVADQELFRQHCAADPDGLADELIRLDGPVQADARVCVQDTLVGGQEIRRGQIAVLFLGAANRDPAVFPRPDDIDLGRRRGTHLGFGRGAHACLGAQFALLQLKAVLTALNESALRFSLAESPVYEQTATLRGLQHLTVSVS